MLPLFFKKKSAPKSCFWRFLHTREKQEHTQTLRSKSAAISFRPRRLDGGPKPSKQKKKFRNRNFGPETDINYLLVCLQTVLLLVNRQRFLGCRHAGGAGVSWGSHAVIQKALRFRFWSFLKFQTRGAVCLSARQICLSFSWPPPATTALQPHRLWMK